MFLSEVNKCHEIQVTLVNTKRQKPEYTLHRVRKNNEPEFFQLTIERLKPDQNMITKCLFSIYEWCFLFENSTAAQQQKM